MPRAAPASLMRDQTPEEEILWHLLEHERYAGGATLSSSPERKIERDLMGLPDQYSTKKVAGAPDDEGHEYEDEREASSVRTSRFAMPPSPGYLPDISAYLAAAAAAQPPPPVPKPTPREMAQATLRQRFTTRLADLERDLGGGGVRVAGLRGPPLPAPPPPHNSTAAADLWIYGWKPSTAFASSYEWASSSAASQQLQQQQQHQQQRQHQH